MKIGLTSSVRLDSQCTKHVFVTGSFKNAR